MLIPIPDLNFNSENFTSAAGIFSALARDYIAIFFAGQFSVWNEALQMVRAPMMKLDHAMGKSTAVKCQTGSGYSGGCPKSTCRDQVDEGNVQIAKRLRWDGQIGCYRPQSHTQSWGSCGGNGPAEYRSRLAEELTASCRVTNSMVEAAVALNVPGHCSTSTARKRDSVAAS